MPEKPNAESPSMQSTGLPVSTAAAIAWPMPMPITPQVPTSSRLRGLYMSITPRDLGDVLVALGRDRAHPVRWRLGPAAAHGVDHRGDARSDVANDRRRDLDVAVHLPGLDVDLHELLGRIAPGLALAVAQEPVEAGTDHHHDVGVLQYRRACGTRALRMGVGQQALGHAHRQERDAALFDQRLDRLVGLRVGSTLAEDDQRLLGGLQYI